MAPKFQITRQQEKTDQPHRHPCSGTPQSFCLVEEQKVLVYSVLDCRLSPVWVRERLSYADHHAWQDVYHGQWNNVALYIKFQRADEYFVVSFKEL